MLFHRPDVYKRQALLSFCVIAKYTASPTMKINAHAIQSLDDKKTTALELTAAATAASAAITFIPGDAGTPIADKLADLSSPPMHFTELAFLIVRI